MKVRFPLSLKISLWLVLNLALLGGAALAFVLAQAGPRWDSLITGFGARHLTQLVSVVVGELGAVDPEDRGRVLERFGAVYGAEFFLFHNDNGQIAGPPIVLPPNVRQRFEERPPADHLRPGPRLGDDDPELSPRGDLPPGERGPGGGARGRFLLRADDGWWIGLRTPFAERGQRPQPGTLFLRVHSLWGVASILDLQTWLAAGAGVLAISFLIWLPLVVGITRSLRRLNHATGEIADGRFDTRVHLRRSDELGALGQSIDAMAARLDTLVHGQKRFLGDVAHELGSPLGRLQVAIEILEARATPSLQAQILDVREEIQLMSTLVNELLAFTQAGLRPRRAQLETVSLLPLLQTACDQEGAGDRVGIAASESLHVAADAGLLTRAVANLVRNALRYAGESSSTTITACRVGSQVLVVIADEGPGVPPDALARLGEPFYRPEAARTRETGGAGLGLAIVKSCVHACGGAVIFRNRTPRGFEAELALRLAEHPAI